MVNKFYLKRGDTKPAIVADLRNPDKSTPDLEGAAILFKMYKRGEEVISAPANPGGTAGRVAYLWQLGDTDEAGRYQGEFEVTFADTSKQTYPNRTYIEIEIVKDLNG